MALEGGPVVVIIISCSLSLSVSYFLHNSSKSVYLSVFLSIFLSGNLSFKYLSYKDFILLFF